MSKRKADEESKVGPTETHPEEMPASLARYHLSQELIGVIERRFSHHAPKGDQSLRYGAIRGMAANVARELAVLCPGSVELDIAVTKLEEMVFWANASIARNEV